MRHLIVNNKILTSFELSVPHKHIHPVQSILAPTSVDGLQISSGSRGVNNGLWGVWLKNGADNLIKSLNVGSRLVRGLPCKDYNPAQSSPTVSGPVVVVVVMRRTMLMHDLDCPTVSTASQLRLSVSTCCEMAVGATLCPAA